jgi:hypothetical protein
LLFLKSQNHLLYLILAFFMLKYLTQLIYPNNCICCYNQLVDSEIYVCTTCLLELPVTNFHTLNENDLEKVFWGRVKIEKGLAMFFYKKGGKVSSASSRADGCCVKGKTKGRMV